MDKEKIIPSRVLELELQIKLLEYLKENKVIDDGMYNYSVNKILNKISFEKNKMNNNEFDMMNYKLVT